MHNKMFEMVILLYLLSIFCIPKSFALLRTSNAANGSIKFADWNVFLNQDGIDNQLEIIPNGDNDSYTLKVASESEVDTSYSIIVSNIPNGVMVKLDGGSFQNPSSNSITFDDVGIIYYTDQVKERNHTLYFKANDGVALVNNQTVNIDVKFEQIL